VSAPAAQRPSAGGLDVDKESGAARGLQIVLTLPSGCGFESLAFDRVGDRCGSLGMRAADRGAVSGVILEP
jgi:hypothetical protein